MNRLLSLLFLVRRGNCKFWLKKYIGQNALEKVDLTECHVPTKAAPSAPSSNGQGGRKIQQKNGGKDKKPLLSWTKQTLLGETNLICDN